MIKDCVQRGITMALLPVASGVTLRFNIAWYFSSFKVLDHEAV